MHTGRTVVLLIALSVFANAQEGTRLVVGIGASPYYPYIDSPTALNFDSSNNLYIADQTRVIKYSSDGVFSNHLGVGTTGYLGDPSSSGDNPLYARGPESMNADNPLYARRGITTANPLFARGLRASAISPQGDQFLATGLSGRILRVSQGIFTIYNTSDTIYDMILDTNGDVIYLTAGQVFRLNLATGVRTLIAGSNANRWSGDNGPAIDATFRLPLAIAMDGSRNIYVSESSRVRKIDFTTGIITTFMGLNGTISVPDPFEPNGLACIGQYLYVANTGGWIHRVDLTSNTATVIAGAGPGYSGDGGSAVNALMHPELLAVSPSGIIAFYDSYNGVIRIINTNGIINTIATKVPNFGDNLPGTSTQLHSPKQISLDNLGNIYIADTLGCVVRKFNTVTNVNRVVVGSGVCAGSIDNVLANQTDAIPGGVIVDPSGNIYFSDIASNVIRKVDAVTKIVNTIAGSTSGYLEGPALSAQMNAPTDLCFDGQGNIVFVDYSNYRVRKLDLSTQTVSLVAGTGFPGNEGNGGPAVNASLIAYSLAFDLQGNLYIAGGAIWKIDRLTGIISIVVGGGNSYSDKIPPVDAALDSISMAFDQYGNLLLASSSCIRLVNFAANTITTLIGNINQRKEGYAGDGGSAISARFSYSYSMIYDASTSTVYISEFKNNVVRAFTYVAQPPNSTDVTTTGGTAIASRTVEETTASVSSSTSLLPFVAFILLLLI